MKKEIKLALSERKLNINKKTISNLNASETNKINLVGAGQTQKGIGCFTHKCRPSW